MMMSVRSGDKVNKDRTKRICVLQQWQNEEKNMVVNIQWLTLCGHRSTLCTPCIWWIRAVRPG